MQQAASSKQQAASSNTYRKFVTVPYSCSLAYRNILYWRRCECRPDCMLPQTESRVAAGQGRTQFQADAHIRAWGSCTASGCDILKRGNVIASPSARRNAVLAQQHHLRKDSICAAQALTTGH